MAREMRHFPSIGAVMTLNMHRLWIIGEEDGLRAQSQQLVALCEVHDVPRRAVRARAYLEWLDGRTGNSEKATKILGTFLQPGLNLWTPCVLLQLSDIEDGAGDHGAAIYHVDEALGITRSTGEIWLEPELIRRRGQLLLSAGGAREEAEEFYLQALDLARLQEGKLFELRTAVSLARLWMDWGRSENARDLLIPVIGMFTDGIVTPDLRTASALLAAL
jgi:tetratricopeptide (TPR) repeat protein